MGTSPEAQLSSWSGFALLSSLGTARIKQGSFQSRQLGTQKEEWSLACVLTPAFVSRHPKLGMAF